MLITKKHISRRQLLRGTGVALSMPLLDAMIPAATAQEKNRGSTTAAILWWICSPWGSTRILGT